MYECTAYSLIIKMRRQVAIIIIDHHCAAIDSALCLGESLGMLFPDQSVLRYPLPDGALPIFV